MKVIDRISFCEICDNATPQVWVEFAGEFGCEYCFQAYGEEMDF